MKEKGSEKAGPEAKNTLYYRQTIENLRQETSKLKDQMSLESTAPLPVGSESYIARLQDQEDTYVRKIKLEAAKSRELDSRIAEIQKKISEKRISLAIPKDNKTKETNETILLKIRKTEHKLDKTLQKFNEVLARNKHLRDEVDNLRKEKLISKDVKSHLDEEIKVCEDEEVKIKVEADGLKTESQALKKKLEETRAKKKVAEHDTEKFVKDLQQLDKVMEKEIKSDENLFMNSALGTPDSGQKELTMTEELSFANSEIREHYSIRDAVKKVEMYSEAFKKIEEVTGVSDVDGLIKLFLEAEKRNYSLFSHVNDLTNDIQSLDKQISDMKREIERYNSIGIHTAEQRELVLSELESKLHFTEIRADQYEKRYEKTMKIIIVFKLGTQQLLEKIGVSDMLGKEGVTESNLMQYLGVVELRTNEILQMYKICQKSLNDTPESSGDMEEERKPIKINYPNITEKDTEEDEGSMILTKQDYMDRVLVKMQEIKK